MPGECRGSGFAARNAADFLRHHRLDERGQVGVEPVLEHRAQRVEDDVFHRAAGGGGRCGNRRRGSGGRAGGGRRTERLARGGRERDAIAVLRAEWSLLNRPERIERLAKKYLKLAPAKPLQLVTVDTVSDRDFDRARLEIAAPAAPAPAAKPVKAAVKASGSVASVPPAEESVSAPWPEAKITRPVEASAE